MKKKEREIVIYIILMFFCLKCWKLWGQVLKMQRKILWEWSKKENKIIWISWDTIYKTKENDNLEIRDLKLFNVGLIGKWTLLCTL